MPPDVPDSIDEFSPRQAFFRLREVFGGQQIIASQVIRLTWRMICGEKSFPTHPCLDQAINNHLTKHLRFTWIGRCHFEQSAILGDEFHKIVNSDLFTADLRHDHLSPKRFRGIFPRRRRGGLRSRHR